MSNRGTGGRDGEAGAAERRLSEALRAQASLGARSSATPGAPAPVKPATPKRGDRKPAGPKSTGQKQPGQKQAGQNPPGAQPGRPTRQGPATPTPVGQSGPHGRGGQSGPQHAAPRPGPGHGAQHGPGRRTRPRDDQLPTTKVATADPGQAEAPTTQQPSAHPLPRQPAPPGPSAPPAPVATAAPGRRVVLDVRLRVALLVGLLAGTLLGSALALLSVLDPGLLPALG